jgi:hypothetical protein
VYDIRYTGTGRPNRILFKELRDALGERDHTLRSTKYSFILPLATG